MSDVELDIFVKGLTDGLARGEALSVATCSGYIALEKAGWKVNNSPFVAKKAIDAGDFKMMVEIEKMGEDSRTAYGWASVIELDGVPVQDLQGDEISQFELTNAAHNFMKNYRQGKQMHEASQQDGVGNVGTVVESLVFTPEVQKALQIDLKKTGWFIGVKIEDDNVLAKVKSGEYKAFSIGGNGERVPVGE